MSEIYCMCVYSLVLGFETILAIRFDSYLYGLNSLKFFIQFIFWLDSSQYR